MARIRTIKPEFFDDPDVNNLSPLAALLFAGLFTQADRRGRMVDEPVRLKYRLMPGRDVDVDALLNELHAAKMVVRYEVDGRKLLCVRTFERHQQPHPREAESVLPAPPNTAKDVPGPEKVMPSREKDVSSHAVSDPVSDPVSGSGNGEGKAAPAVPRPTLLMKPLGYRPRIDVAWPGKPPVPGSLHAELRDRLAGDPDAADARLRAWYPVAAEPYANQDVGDDPYKFWNARFREWIGTTVRPVKASKTAGNAAAAREALNYLERTGQ